MYQMVWGGKHTEEVLSTRNVYWQHNMVTTNVFVYPLHLNNIIVFGGDHILFSTEIKPSTSLNIG